MKNKIIAFVFALLLVSALFSSVSVVSAQVSNPSVEVTTDSAVPTDTAKPGFVANFINGVSNFLNTAFEKMRAWAEKGFGTEKQMDSNTDGTDNKALRQLQSIGSGGFG